MHNLLCSEGFRIFLKALLYIVLALSVYVVLRGGVIFLAIMSSTMHKNKDLIYSLLVAYVILSLALFFLAVISRSIKARKLNFSLSLSRWAYIIFGPVVGFFAFYSYWDSQDKTIFVVFLSLMVVAVVFRFLRKFALSRSYFNKI